MRHPNENINELKVKMLANMPEIEREWHERMYGIGIAKYCYYAQAGKQDQDHSSVEPTEEEFRDWLERLPENIKRDMESKGFESCKNILPFTRYVLERRDIALEEWMKEHLSEDDYKWWKYKG